MGLFLSQFLPWLLAGGMAAAALLLLRQPLFCLGRLCLRTAASLAALAVFSPLQAVLGFGLGST